VVVEKTAEAANGIRCLATGIFEALGEIRRVLGLAAA
jgi:hypothetical protein